MSKDELIANQLNDALAVQKIWSGIIFNVKAYGAVGDGKNDDTVAVQAAINAASKAGGGQVRFPVGTYLISSTLRVPHFVSLVGLTKRKPYIVTNFDGTAVKLEGQGIRLDGLLIDSTGSFGGTIGTGNAVDIISTPTINASWTIIQDCELVGAGSSLNIDGSTAMEQPGNYFITNNVFYTGTGGTNAVRVVNARYVNCSNNMSLSTGTSEKSSVYFGENTNNCFWVGGTINGDFTFDGNQFRLTGATVSGNTVINGSNLVSSGCSHVNVTLTNLSSTNVFISKTSSYVDNGTSNRNGLMGTDVIPLRPRAFANNGLNVTSASFTNIAYDIFPGRAFYPDTASFTLIAILSVDNPETTAEYRLTNEDGSVGYGSVSTNSTNRMIVTKLLNNLPNSQSIIQEGFRSTNNVNNAIIHDAYIRIQW